VERLAFITARPLLVGCAMGERKFVWATPAVVSLTNLIIAIDSFFLNVAITTLVRELHTTVQVIRGIIAAYASP
jgi:hypothetical protein